jgi:hypothetical protein
MEYEKIKVSGTNKGKVLSIILYTDKHPFVKKCLRDTDYWNSLSERSGNDWNIYAVKPQQGSYEFPDSKSGYMQFMIQIWKEPADNKQLIDLLGLDDTEELPLIYFFKLSEDETIIDDICIKIEGNTEQEVYTDLENIITKVSESIKNKKCSFEDIKKTIKTIKLVKGIKKGAKILSDLNSLIPGII